MKRLLIVVLILFAIPSFATEPLKGQLEEIWTIDKARQEALHDAQLWIDGSYYSAVDPNLMANRMLIRAHQSDRSIWDGNKATNCEITVFDSGGYSVLERSMTMDKTFNALPLKTQNKLISTYFNYFWRTGEFVSTKKESPGFYYESDGQLNGVDLTDKDSSDKSYKYSYPSGILINGIIP